MDVDIERRISISKMPIILDVSLCILFIVTSVFIYMRTQTYNVLALLVPLTVAIIDPLFATSVAIGSRSKKALYAVYIISIALFICSIATVIYLLYSLRSVGFASKIINSHIAIVYLLGVIILAYIGNIFIEKLCGDLYWRVGRIISEDLITVIYVSAIGLIGPSIAFFGVKKLDSYLAVLTILVSLIPVTGKFKALLSIRKIKEFNQNVQSGVSSWLSNIPIIKHFDRPDVWSAWLFSHVSLSVDVSRVIVGRENDLIDVIAIPLIDTIGTLCCLDISIRYTDSYDIFVAIPTEDEMNVGKGLTNKFVIAKLDPIDFSLKEKEKKTIEIVSELADSDIIKGLVKYSVDVLCLRDSEERIRNLANGWMMKVVNIKSQKIDDAINEVIDILRKEYVKEKADILK